MASRKLQKGGKKDGPVLVPQPHGGALLTGGQKGQTPGPGRPPSEIRRTLRKRFDEQIPILLEIAKNPEAKETDRIRAIDLLAKYGLGEEKGWSHDLVAALVRELADTIERHVSDKETLKLIEASFKDAIRRHKP